MEDIKSNREIKLEADNTSKTFLAEHYRTSWVMVRAFNRALIEENKKLKVAIAALWHRARN